MNKLEELMKEPIRATGTVDITAATEEGKEDGTKAMKINAYNGGLISVGGWGLPVGIELAGLSWREDSSIPILCLHKTYSIDAICGQSKKITADGNSLNVEAEFMPVTDEAKKIYALAKVGYKFQASVGVKADDVLYVGANESAMLNGAEIKGECYIVRAGTLNEVSIVPLGADGTTNTAIAAAQTKGKEGEMPEVKNTVEAAKPTTETVEAAQVERDRVASVIEACKGHADIMAQAVKEGWTAEKAELACLKAEKAEAEKAKIEAARPSAPSIVNLKAAAGKEADAKMIAAAACLGGAMKESTVEAQFKGVDLDAAKDLGVTRLSDVFAAMGFDYRPGDVAGMTKAIKAAFSTAEIPNVLTNIAHKFVLAGFGAVGEDWRKVSRAVPVVDFKAVKGVRLLMGGVLQPLAKGGELKHVALSDEARDLRAATKGSIIGITREDLINDDLGVLATIPERFGQMAGRTINKDVFALIAGLANSAFGANTTGALTVDNLARAYGLAMELKDSNGDPIAALPTKILVSPSSVITARNIYLSEKVTGATSKTADANPMRSILEPISSPYLTGSKFYLFNESFPLVDVAFLNGRQTPVVETAEADFNQLGIQMRCYYDFGVAAGETKAALVSTGA